MTVEPWSVSPVLCSLPPACIRESLVTRRLHPAGIAHLTASMRRSGFLDHFPLLVLACEDGTFLLIDGRHRLRAAREVGLEQLPCLVKRGLPEQECYELAFQSNMATETLVPSTLVTYAEFIWARSAQYTQQQIADMLHWSRGKVSQYALLSKIARTNPDAWECIATTFEQAVALAGDLDGAASATPVAFTEFLLRDILDLRADQQLELVQALANGQIRKGRFTDLARAYQARNAMEAYALPQINALGEDLTAHLLDAIASGAYDADWKHPEHPKLHKLIASLREEWERLHRIHLIHGSFPEASQPLADGCIDLILTDPPYNLAQEETFVLEGRAPISQDFGSWDKHADDAFLTLMARWAREWARLLRSEGSGYVFAADRALSHLRATLEEAGLHVKATLVWHKTNPAPQVVKTNFNSSVEYLLFFTKGQGGHTFNWQGEEEMHNHIETPICGGNERLVDGKGRTLHPTQKPEQLIRHLLQISSNRGDLVFDGFAGTATVAKVAKDLGRKCISIEQDEAFFRAGQRRVEGA